MLVNGAQKADRLKQNVEAQRRSYEEAKEKSQQMHDEIKQLIMTDYKLQEAFMHILENNTASSEKRPERMEAEWKMQRMLFEEAKQDNLTEIGRLMLQRMELDLDNEETWLEECFVKLCSLPLFDVKGAELSQAAAEIDKALKQTDKAEASAMQSAHGYEAAAAQAERTLEEIRQEQEQMLQQAQQAEQHADEGALDQ